MPLSMPAAEVIAAAANLTRLPGIILLRDADEDKQLEPPTRVAASRHTRCGQRRSTLCASTPSPTWR